MPRTSAARRKDEPPRTYLLKVTLMETDPPIWRRLIVPGDTRLAGLDRIIQAAMGWTNSHLHTFTIGGVLHAEPSPEWEVEVRDERRVRLADVAREEGEAFVYEYDLGDSWRHQVLVEEVIAGGRTRQAGLDASEARGRVRRRTRAGSGATTTCSSLSAMPPATSTRERGSGLSP